MDIEAEALGPLTNRRLLVFLASVLDKPCLVRDLSPLANDLFHILCAWEVWHTYSRKTLTMI